MRGAAVTLASGLLALLIMLAGFVLAGRILEAANHLQLNRPYYRVTRIVK
jgi:hypothetical protein